MKAETLDEPEEVQKENPYLFDCSGPRKVIDYSKPEAVDDDDNLYSFDLDDAMNSFPAGEYSVKGQGEKFMLSKPTQAMTDEEKEMAEALA